MTISALRTIVVPQAQQLGVTLSELVWPIAQPDSILDYSLDLSALLAETNDLIETATVSVSPSGAGELQITAAAANAGVVTAWLSGGYAGRTYLIKVDIATVAGRTFEFIVSLPISFALATGTAPAPTNGFGTPVIVTMPTTFASTALENSHLVKAQPGMLFAVNLNATATGYFMLFDATAVPVDGAVTPLKAWAFDAAESESINLMFSPALLLRTGIAIAFSSTGPFTKTTPGAASAQFSGEYA